MADAKVVAATNRGSCIRYLCVKVIICRTRQKSTDGQSEQSLSIQKNFRELSVTLVRMVQVHLAVSLHFLLVSSTFVSTKEH